MNMIESIRSELLHGSNADKSGMRVGNTHEQKLGGGARIKKFVHHISSLLGVQIVKRETLLKLERAFYHDMSRIGYVEFSHEILRNGDAISSVFSLLNDDESVRSVKSFIEFYFSRAYLPWDRLLQVEFSGFPEMGTVRDALRAIQASLPVITGGDGDALDTLLYCIFGVEQYRLPGICEVEAGDLVIDAGCCLGETAIYFAQKSPGGIVYSFEPNSDMAALARRNIVANNLGDSIIVCPYALGEVVGTARFSAAIGGGSHFSDEGSVTVDVTTIDAMASQWDRPVNFIKMDIEGAELSALKGAVATIRRDRPKLALALYHKPGDLYEIPFFLRECCENYAFFVRDKAELVLFAVPEEKLPDLSD